AASWKLMLPSIKLQLLVTVNPAQEDEDHVPTPSRDPLPNGEDRFILNELMVFCTTLQEQDDASKQGRMIEEIYQNTAIVLDDETQGRKNDDEMFRVDDLAGKEVVMETTTGVKDKQEMSTTILTAATIVTTAVPTPRAKGIIFHKQKQSQIPTVSSSKEKGKAKIIEPEVLIKRKEQMRIDEELLAKKLQAREWEEFSEVQKARLLVELIEKRKKHFAALRAQEKGNKPPTKTHMKSQMSTYLKHMGGYKQSHLKGRSFDKIKKLFDKEMTKVDKNVKPVIYDSEELRKRIEIVLDDEDEERRPISRSLEQMVTLKSIILLKKMFKNFNREDLEVLWDIVKDGFKKEKPVDDMDNLLFRTLKTLFEHHVENTIWKFQQGLAKVKN
nr:hypothetical protein [Tanacetum cinerariifolium]